MNSSGVSKGIESIVSADQAETEGKPEVSFRFLKHHGGQNFGVRPGGENIFNDTGKTPWYYQTVWRVTDNTSLGYGDNDILALDGSMQPYLGNYPLTQEAALRIWQRLPFTPVELNSRGEIWVLNGDLHEYDLQKILDAFLNYHHTPEINQGIEQHTPLGSNYALQKFLVHGVALIGAAGLFHVLRKHNSDSFPDLLDVSLTDSLKTVDNLPVVNETTINAIQARLKESPVGSVTRRQVLKFFGYSASVGLLAYGGSVLTSSILYEKAAESDSQLMHDLLLKLGSIGEIKDSLDVLINGRTALLNQKTIDAMKQSEFSSRNLTKGVIVMGDLHAYRANDYNKHEGIRLKAIEEYLLSMHEIVTTVAQETGQDKNKLLKHVFKLIAQVDMIPISQPDINPNDPNAPIEKLQEAIGKPVSFYSKTVLDLIYKVDPILWATMFS